MASKHQLSLDIPETNNCQVLRVFDTSLYTEDLEVTCGTLQITSPGFNEPVNIEVLPGFNLILNACTLGIQSSGCGTTSQRLPDGIYTIRYSVSPNDKVYVEYQYLRVCQTLNKYFNFLCKLEMAACEPQPDVKADLEQLRMIRSFIDAAKVKVEYCESPQQGMDLFLYAQSRLQKFGKDCC
jgi:hypothetical protein